MKRKRRGFQGLLLFLLFMGAMAYLVYDSNTRIVTTEYELSYSHLPEAFENYRIVQLSDVHAAEFGGSAQPIVDAVQEAQPDLIAVTGDLIDADGQGDYVRELMQKLVAIAPVYYVTGNHEWASGSVKELFSILEECGVTVLRNSYRKITVDGESILLAGLEDPNGPADMKTPETLMSEIRAAEGEDAFVVLLAHRNDRIQQYSALGADLILCGHAHGGIIRLPFTDGLINTNREWFPSYTSGVYTENGTDFLVSRGVGNHTGVPRFLNNPHIPVAVLKTAAE